MALLPARGQLTIRVNIATTALYVAGNLAASIVAFQNFARLPADRFVRYIKVETMHIQSRKTVKRLAAQNSNTLALGTADFGQVTVREYFSRRRSNCDSTSLICSL